MKQQRGIPRPAVAVLAMAFVFVAFAGGILKASAQAGGTDLPSPGLPVAPGLHAAIGGEWTGKYVCAQGVTGVRLVLSEDGSRALFHFFAVADNPGVPEGCFSMSGLFESSGNSLRLKADKWILRPRNYITVNISGTVDASGQSFSGRLLGARGCTEIFLTHVASSRPLPNACARALP